MAPAATVIVKFWPSQPGDFKKHYLPQQQVPKNHIIDGPSCTNNAQHNKSKQVLNIYHTAIENEDTSETQKAIIQEMCNVVWKALDVKKSE